MKKKFSEIKHLINGIAAQGYGVTPDTEVEVEWVEPRTLLTYQRLELAIRYKYIEAREKGWDTKFFSDMYAAVIPVFNRGSYSEPGNPAKNSLEAHFKIFDKLIEEIKNNGFDENISLVPVGHNNILLEGSHRTSCAIYFNKKIPVVRFPNLSTNASWTYFAANGMERKYIDYATAVLIKLLNRPNFHVGIIWSRADFSKIPQAEKILSEETEVIYRKTFQSDFNFVRNIVIAAYSGNKNNAWLGSFENNFIGADVKAFNCHQNGGQLRAYFFYAKPSTNILELKQKVRNIFQIGNDSFHTTDTNSDADIFVKIFLNRNTTDLFKYGEPYKNFNLISKLKSFRESIWGGGVGRKFYHRLK